MATEQWAERQRKAALAATEQRLRFMSILGPVSSNSSASLSVTSGQSRGRFKSRINEWESLFMSVRRISLVALVISLSVLGCHTNANYCPGLNPDNNCSESDGGFDSMPPCKSNASCSAPIAICDLSGGGAEGRCVQCTATDKAACTGTTPICGADDACQPCSAHSQCASNVCLPNGACSAENATDVAYVAPSGGGSLCTQSMPCPLLSTALMTKRTYIKISGTIQEKVSVKDQTVTLLADPNATLSGINTGGSATLLKVDGTSNLTIYDLTISDSTSHGIAVVDNNSTVSLRRSKILRSSGAGINADGGILNVSQSIIAQNDGGGILMNSATTFDIRNNFIVRNGDLASSLAGGVRAVPGGNLMDPLVSVA